MICYKDTTFCASKVHRQDCTRILTKDDKERAAKLGLPVAFGHFCEPKGERVELSWIDEFISEDN